MISALGPFTSGLGAGGAGVATNNQSHNISIDGVLLGFFIRYNDAPPATTDLTIETLGGILPARVILSLPNFNTSGYYPVLIQARDAAGAAIAGEFHVQPFLRDTLKVTMAQANDNDSIEIWPVVKVGG